jgi:MazG family protein
MTLKPILPPSPIEELLDIMAKLRNPAGGCPWDLEQTFTTIAPYTIEEAYEVADAITQDNMTALREELGDLLLQVVFHSQMAKEAGHFTFNEVVETISEKMVVRHPHVFGTAEVKTATAQTENWEKLKERERKHKGAGSILDGVALGLPALMRAEKLQNRAARVGFQWADIKPAFDKVEEELAEVREAAEADDQTHIEEEMGDLIFMVANLARYLKVDPETALRKCNAKFERRFRHIEARLLEQGKSPDQSSLEEMDKLWNEAKLIERGEQAA